jgi:hypothetical protein
MKTKKKLATGDKIKNTPISPTPVKEVTVYGKGPATVGTTPEYRARVDSTSKANLAADALARQKRGAPPLNTPALKKGGKVVKKKK